MKKVLLVSVLLGVAQLFAVAQVQDVEDSKFSKEGFSSRQYGFVKIINESSLEDFTVSNLSFKETGSLVKKYNWAKVRDGYYQFTEENASLKVAVSLVNFTKETQAYEDVYYENGVEMGTGEIIYEEEKGDAYNSYHIAFKVTFSDGRSQIVSGEIQVNQEIESGKEVGHSYYFTITDELLGIRKNSISFKNSTSFEVMLKSSEESIVVGPGETASRDFNSRKISEDGIYSFETWIKVPGFSWAQIEGREISQLAIANKEAEITTSDLLGEFVTTPNPILKEAEEGRKSFNSLNDIKSRKKTTTWIENGTGKMLVLYIPKAIEGSLSDLSDMKPYVLDLSQRPLALEAVPGQYPVLYYTGKFSGKFKIGTIGITNQKSQKVAVGYNSIFSY
jgi:hypothetical protein